jgi:hypothetical protein
MLRLDPVLLGPVEALVSVDTPQVNPAVSLSGRCEAYCGLNSIFHAMALDDPAWTYLPLPTRKTFQLTLRLILDMVHVKLGKSKR